MLTPEEKKVQRDIAGAPEDFACACGEDTATQLCATHALLLISHPDLEGVVLQIARANYLASGFRVQYEEAWEAFGECMAARHVIEFRIERWSLLHPLRCRPELLDCEVEKAATAYAMEPPLDKLDRFYADVDADGKLVIGEVAPLGDPLFDRLRAAL